MQGRRSRILVLILILLIALGVLILDRLQIGRELSDDQDNSGELQEQPPTTALVTQRDLVETLIVDGRLGYGSILAFPTNSAGIVTGLPSVGDTIGFGESLFWVDHNPVILLPGELPQWRAFEHGMNPGDDILQLERALSLLVDDDTLVVDEEFNVHTASLISVLQKTLGGDGTGVLPLGSVAYSNEPVRIANVNIALGQNIGPQVAVLDITTTVQEVEIELDPDRLDLFKVGTPATIMLPTGDVFDGEVREIGTVARQEIDLRTGETGDPAINVRVSFVGPIPDGHLDAAPVEVEVVKTVTVAALTVPIVALVALGEGGHAVEVWDGHQRQLVAVETGKFAEAHVEIAGDLRDGDAVVVPSP